MMDQEQGTTTVEARASIVEFVHVEVIDDGGPKVLVKLGQNNNGEPVDVAVVVMAPEVAKILSVNLADATFEANWGPLLRISSN
jgi:hypothetical protein